MNLEKSFRAFVSPAYDSAETIAATDEEAIDLAHLNTDLRPGGDVMPVFDDEYWPNSLILRVRLLPVLFNEERRQVKAVFISNETSFEPTLLYDPVHQDGQLRNNCVAGVDLIYEGSGVIYQETTSQSFMGWQAGDLHLKSLQARPELLYHKPFPFQRVSLLTCTQRHLGAGKWSITTHLKKMQSANEVPIFSYGGIYQPQQALEQVVPIYATLAGTSEHTTRVTLKSQKFWHDKGVVETQAVKLGDTTYAFHDSMSQEEVMSLSAAIVGGKVKVSLEIREEIKIYQSRRFQRISQNEGLVDIAFVTTE